jgi:adenine phosphoribosyltransferase
LKEYLRLIDTKTQGRRYDVTPLFADYAAFSTLVEDLAQPFTGGKVDCVAGIDALGFVLGAAMAIRLKVGFIPVRKGGKLPVASDTSMFVDYTGQSKSLELRLGAVPAGTRVLIVDEWVETGAQVQAAIELIEKQGGVVAGIAAINIDDGPRTRVLRKKYMCHAVWQEHDAQNPSNNEAPE